MLRGPLRPWRGRLLRPDPLNRLGRARSPRAGTAITATVDDLVPIARGVNICRAPYDAPAAAVCVVIAERSVRSPACAFTGLLGTEAVILAPVGLQTGTGLLRTFRGMVSAADCAWAIAASATARLDSLAVIAKASTSPSDTGRGSSASSWLPEPLQGHALVVQVAADGAAGRGQRAWIGEQRRRQVPRLGLERLAVSESEARIGARELVAALAEEEAEPLGAAYRASGSAASPRSGAPAPTLSVEAHAFGVVARVDIDVVEDP